MNCQLLYLHYQQWTEPIVEQHKKPNPKSKGQRNDRIIKWANKHTQSICKGMKKRNATIGDTVESNDTSQFTNPFCRIGALLTQTKSNISIQFQISCKHLVTRTELPYEPWAPACPWKPNKGGCTTALESWHNSKTYFLMWWIEP